MKKLKFKTTRYGKVALPSFATSALVNTWHHYVEGNARAYVLRAYRVHPARDAIDWLTLSGDCPVNDKVTAEQLADSMLRTLYACHNLPEPYPTVRGMTGAIRVCEYWHDYTGSKNTTIAIAGSQELLDLLKYIYEACETAKGQPVSWNPLTLRAGILVCWPTPIALFTRLTSYLRARKIFTSMLNMDAEETTVHQFTVEWEITPFPE